MNLTVEQKNYLFIITTFVIVIGGYTYFSHQQKKYSEITSFKECLAAGYSVIITYPEECRIPGRRFINPEQKTAPKTTPEDITSSSNDFINGAYILNGQLIRLQKGILEFVSNQNNKGRLQINASSTYQVDINNDNVKDTIFIIEEISSTPASTTKQYLTASVSLRSGFVGLNMLSLGEASGIPTIEYRNTELILTYQPGMALGNLLRRFKMGNDILVERISP